MKITINNKQFNFFASYGISLKYNAIASTFSFDALQDKLGFFIEYPNIQIFDDNDNLMLTGTCLAPNLKQTTKPELTQIGGYSLPGILEDCVIPVSSYPLQFDNLSLNEITSKVIKPFDIKFISTSNISTEFNKKYPKVAAEPSQSIKDFLTGLATQRNIILTNNEKGEIVFTRYIKQMPSARLEEGQPGINNIQLSINSQALHSEITVMRQATNDNPDSGEYTIQNPYCSKFRPTIKTLDSADIFDVQKAARNELSNELTNIQITFQTTRLYKPGEIVELKAPSININAFVELFIQETEITGTTKDEYYQVKCVLPDIYQDNKVKSIFQ